MLGNMSARSFAAGIGKAVSTSSWPRASPLKRFSRSIVIDGRVDTRSEDFKNNREEMNKYIELLRSTLESVRKGNIKSVNHNLKCNTNVNFKL